MNDNFSKLSKSSNSQEYGTPIEFYKQLDSIFHFKLDPCTTKDNPLGTKHFYYKTDVPDDGMSGPWNYNTYINPPFGKGIKNWILKMDSEAKVYGGNVYVMLLPARTDTKWFQEYIMTRCRDNSVIYLLKGRLKFINPVLNGKSEPHIIGSMLWIKNPEFEQIDELLKTIPGILLDDWIIK